MRRALAVALVVSPLVLVAAPAQAVTCTLNYTGAAGGAWSVDTNWTVQGAATHRIPTASDVVCLNLATHADAHPGGGSWAPTQISDSAGLTIDAGSEVDLFSKSSVVTSLTIDGRLVLGNGGADLTATGATSMGPSSNLQVVQATLHSNGITSSGYVGLEQATLDSAMTLDDGSDIAYGQGPSTITGALVVHTGGQTEGSEGSLEVGSLQLKAGSETLLQGSNTGADASITSDSTMQLAGDLTVSSLDPVTATVVATDALVASTSRTGRFDSVNVRDHAWSPTYTVKGVDLLSNPPTGQETYAWSGPDAPTMTVVEVGRSGNSFNSGYAPELSRGARWLTYQDNGGAVRDIDLTGSSGGGTNIASSSGLRTTDVDPGDGKVWFSLADGLHTVDVDDNANSVKVAGTSAGQVTPAVSPDGTRVVFASTVTRGLAIEKIDGTGTAAIAGTVPAAATDCATLPQWASGTDLVVFEVRACTSTGNGPFTPMVIASTGGTAKALSSAPMTETYGLGPRTSEDGSTAFFAATVAGHQGIWVLPVAPGLAPSAPALVDENGAQSVSRPTGPQLIGTTFPFGLSTGGAAVPFTALVQEPASGTFEVVLAGSPLPTPAQVTMTAFGQPVTFAQQDSRLVADIPLDSTPDELVTQIPMTVSLARSVASGTLTAGFAVYDEINDEDSVALHPRQPSNTYVAARANTRFTVTNVPLAPSAPGVTLTAADGQVTYTVTAPASDGGAPVTGYTVTITGPGAPGPIALTGPGTHTITGLTDGGSYTISVTATNSAGVSPPGVAGPVVPHQPPAAPVITGVSPSPRSLLVGFTQAKLPGAADITGWTTTCKQVTGTNSGSVTGGPPSVKVTGLIDNTDYTCVVVAHSASGDVSSLPHAGRPGRLPTVKITIKAGKVKVSKAGRGTKLTITGTGTVGDRPAANRRIVLTFRQDKTKVRKTIATTTSNSKGAFTFHVTFAKAGAYQAQLPLGPAVAFNKEVFVKRAV